MMSHRQREPRSRVTKEDRHLSTNALAANSSAAAQEDGPVAPNLQTPAGLLARILDSLSQDKAEDVVEIDLRGRSSVADHMVVASGRSTRQVSAMAEKLVERLKADSAIVPKVEGKDAGDWVLIDAGDVIVHIFRPEVREFYQLEKMWLPTGQATGQAAK
jgi:ribosome-associated protein